MNRNYIIKHWIATLLLGPFLLCFYEFVRNVGEESFLRTFELYPIIFIFSLACSIPTLTVCHLVFVYLIKKQANPKASKFTLISITIIGIAITILNIGGSMSMDMVLYYSIAAIITGMLLKINLGSRIKANKIITEIAS